MTYAFKLDAIKLNSLGNKNANDCSPLFEIGFYGVVSFYHINLDFDLGPVQQNVIQIVQQK